MAGSSTQEARVSYEGEESSVKTRSTKAVARAQERVETSPDELTRKVRMLLDSQRIAAAKEAAARGAELFPGHPWLEQANKVLNPTRVTVSPARDRGFDRRKEYDWLRRNREEYQGRWVVLLEDRLLASANSFEDAVGQVRPGDLKARPLVHHVE